MKNYNPFGTQDGRPDENLLKALCRGEVKGGIPGYNYPKMVEILSQALPDEELFEIVTRGLGINRPRQTQKNIATELGVDPGYISKRAHEGVKKLQASPYKVMLLNLVQTPDEVDTYIDKLQVENSHRAELEISNKKLSLENKNLKAKLEEHASERSHFIFERERLEDRLAKAEADNAKLRSENSRLSKRSHDEVRAKLMMDVFDSYAEHIEESAKAEIAYVDNLKKTLIASLADIGSGGLLVKELNVSDDAVKALHRAKIYNVDQILALPERNLVKMVGQNVTREVWAAIRKKKAAD